MGYTVFHEVAHILLEHNYHGPREEIEANFFASQFIAPNCLIAELKRRGYNITRSFLMGVFNLGREAAQKKINYFSKMIHPHASQYDSSLVEKFRPWLNLEYPIKTPNTEPEWAWMTSRLWPPEH